jgi:hypothetical protein
MNILVLYVYGVISSASAELASMLSFNDTNKSQSIAAWRSIQQSIAA